MRTSSSEQRVVVEAVDLVKSFGELRAVDGVTFRVEPGLCFGMLGPNGAGKTSTIRMIYGYSPITSGRLEVFGLDVTGHRRAVAQRIGVCQQENNLDPDLTVAENLMVFARYFDIDRGEAAARTEEALSFIAPALVAVTIMQNAFFENTYSSFVRMYYQKTFDAMLATPLSLADVITGEIVWGATRSAIAATLMLVAITPFGLLSYPSSLLVIPLAFLGGVAFGSAGMWFTGVLPTIDMFNLPVFLFITPMFLFSGTFFPLQNLPHWARYAALALPLTHLVQITRALTFGSLEPHLLWNLAYLVGFTAVAFPLAMGRMRARLIA